MASLEEFGQLLQSQTSGCQISTRSLTTRRTMEKDQVARVAAEFAADTEAVGGSRLVIRRSHELVKPVYRVLQQSKTYVRSVTLDFPEQAMRLIRLDRIESVTERINEYRDELHESLEALASGWGQVMQDARERLGDLYCEDDYVANPKGHFAISLSFPSIEPDNRLKGMHPELYEAERARIAHKFEEAVRLAEEAAAAQIAKMLKHFSDRLAADEEGKPRTIKASTLGNIRDFVVDFREQSLGSNQELEELVGELESLASGVDLDRVRKASPSDRAALAEQFEALLQKADSLVIERPVREIDL